jgi:hypothetical protein
MSRRSLRLGVSASLLVLSLSLSPSLEAAASRTHGPTPRAVQQEPESPSLLRVLWNMLSSVWAKEGVKIDPNG